jgi:hypothetical protein
MEPSKNVAPGAAAVDALRRQQQASCNPMQPGATPCNRVQPNRAVEKTNPPRSPASATAPATKPAPRRLTPITQFVLHSVIEQTCNAMQPHATPCNATQPKHAAGKTNPPPPFSNSRQPAHAATVTTTPPPPAAPVRTASGAPPTPLPADVTLTPRQLAAARLIAGGMSLPDVAAELTLNRSTVWRWTRDPTFQAELRRLHLRWSERGTPASPPPPHQS